MSDNQKGIFIHIGFGAVVATLVMALNWNMGYPLSQLFCDGFFVAAVLLLGCGGMKFVRNQGFFDMLTYSVTTTFQIHFPFSKMNSPLEERNEDFVDYKERKRAKRKSAAELLWAGLVYLVLSFIAFVVYMLTVGQ